nr:MAG TPA: tail sheath protein [Caudoviricetes sp.]
MATSLTIVRQNGNVPKSQNGQDHVSGFVAYLLEADIPAAFKTEPVQAVSTIDKAEELGITADATAWSVKMLHYQLEEVFRINPSITLYVGLFSKPENMTFQELKTVQNYAEGAIRQMAIWNGDTAPTADNIVKLESVADSLDTENAPLSTLYAPLVSNYKNLPSNLATNNPRVSVVIAQAGSGTGAELYKSKDNKTKATVSAIGVALGTLSKAAVHQCIAWVKNFPSGISMPALGDGTLVRTIDKGELEKLDTNRYLFLNNVVGVAGSYWNDSHTMDSPTSDYAAIESVRTMDKAVRGIRTYLTPELGGNVYIDPDTGKLQSYTVSHLETTANIPLEEMEKAGELSGYKAEIDAEQDVLSTSTIEVTIKNVPVGVVRKFKVKIGFVKSLE